jgi:hypothetical protein
MLRLTVHHNIHLTKEQRYALHNGEDVAVVGVSLPIWTHKNVTTEPGREVFCQYILKNPKQELPIKILTNGYEITIPYREGTKLEISNEEYRKLVLENPEELERLYEKTIREVSSKNLLDIKDGGSEFLNYKELNHAMVKQKEIHIMHHVTIGTYEKLEKSFI